MTFLRLAKSFLILAVLSIAQIIPVYAQPGLPTPPEDVPINGFVLILILIAKGLGIYKIMKSKKK